jgi:hypothetical protein
MTMFRYRLFGLIVGSEIELPELLPADPGLASDVEIRIGDAGVGGAEKWGLSVYGPEALLRIDQVGDYRIIDGRKIVVTANPAASDRNVRLYLLGSAFAAILHQRGLLPLHANAIVLEGRAIAVLGHPQAGKSTLAAWFVDKGWEMLADDVCVVTWDEAGRPLAHPGIGRVRLWRDALEASGRSAGDHPQSFDDMDKYDVRIAGVAREPVPLDHIYLLAKAEGPGEIRPLTGSDAFQSLVANTYRGSYLPLMGEAERHFRQCVRLAGNAPLFEASRKWGLHEIDTESARIEAHALALIRGRKAAG